jgi:hypothetical protein
MNIRVIAAIRMSGPMILGRMRRLAVKEWLAAWVQTHNIAPASPWQHTCGAKL